MASARCSADPSSVPAAALTSVIDAPLPGRNAKWRVEWRVPSDRFGKRMHIVSRKVRGGQRVRALALAVGMRALAGEFRLTVGARPPIVVDLQRMRSWNPQEGLPATCPKALWSLELARAASADDFRHAVRTAVAAAVSAGVISAADGSGLARLASELGGR